MVLILRFVLRNIREKKLRTFLILLSVLLAGALWFASNGLATTLEGMFVQRMRIFYGSSDLIVHADRRSPGPFLRPAPAEALAGRVEYAIPVFQAGAEAIGRRPGRQRETVQLELTGIDLADLARANPLQLTGPLDPSSFQGQRLILARETAERFGLRPGDPWTWRSAAPAGASSWPRSPSPPAPSRTWGCAPPRSCRARRWPRCTAPGDWPPP